MAELHTKQNQWNLHHICSKTESLPPDFFQFSTFGRSLTNQNHKSESKSLSDLKIENFRKVGFPLNFCIILENGLPLLLQEIPPRRTVRNHAPAREAENLTFVKETLEKWESTGVIRFIPNELHIMNPFNVVTNGTKKRLVLDARTSGLNDYILASKFRLPDVESIVNVLHKNDFLIKMDLASGFLQLPINQAEQTYLGFRSPVYRRWGVLQRLPFGLRSALFLFQSFTNALQQAADEILHIKTHVYIDDWLLWNHKENEVLSDFLRFTKFLEFLGVKIQHEKTEGPGQAITYLGIIIDTTSLRVVLLEAKRIKYLQGIQEILHEQTTSMSALAKTAGRLVHIATVHKAGAANIQPLWDVIYLDKKQWTRTQLEKEIYAIDDDLRDCLQWWEKALACTNIERKLWMTADGELFMWLMNTVKKLLRP